jgi:proline iminopeptidase
MTIRFRFRILATSVLALSTTLGACGDDPGEGAPIEAVPKTVDEDPGLSALDLSSTRLHVRTVGKDDGDVIIVLHGGPGDDYRYMLPLAERAGDVSLGDEHKLVFWDQRGVGQSRRHDADELTLDDYMRDLDELITHYSPDAPVALLGHSWGGTYATMYLNAHPERVRAAALLEPGGLSSSLRDDEESAAQGMLLEQIVGPYLANGRGLSAAQHARADGALIAALRAMLPDSDVPVSRMGALVLRVLEFGELQQPFDFTTHLDEVPFETLFVVGADSEDLGKARQEQQRAFFPSSRLEVIAGADHNALTLSRAEAVIPILVDYFRR